MPKPENPSATPKLFPLLPLLLLPFVVILLYGHTFQSPFHFDDKDLIKNNPAIQDLFDPGRAIAFNQSRPALMVSLAFSYHFSGLNVFGYHLFNILLHSLSSMLILTLCFLLYYASRKKEEPFHTAFIGVAFLATLFFAMHPMNTEAVTYICGRSSLLATFFLLLAFYFFFKMRLCHRMGFKIVYAVAAYTTYCLSIASKEVGVVLPILLLGAEYYFFYLPENKNRARPPLFLEYLKTGGKALLPFFLIILALFAIRYRLQGAFLEKDSAFLAFYSRAAYVFTQINVVPYYYINKMFFPQNQNVDIYFSIYKTFFNVPTLVAAACILGLFLLAVRRRFSGIWLSFSIFWFLVSLSPTSSFVPITDVAVERRLYLSGIGVAFLAVHFLSKPCLGRIIPSVIVLFFFCANCMTRNAIYRDELSLWRDSVRKAPAKERPHNNLGDVYNVLGLYEKAVEELLEAVRIEPLYANAHFNLGVVYGRMGLQKDAFRELKMSEIQGYSSPDLYYNLGVLYEEKGLFDKAEKKYLLAMKLKPEYFQAHCNLGNIYVKLDRLQDAIGEYRMVLKWAPDYDKGHYNLGNTLGMLGQYQDALGEFKAAIGLNPNHSLARYGCALIYYHQDRLEEAVDELQAALRIDPDFKAARERLEEINSRMGKVR